MTISVSGPPQRRSRTSATSSPRRLPRHQRHEVELAEQRLEEGDLDLQRVLARVGLGDHPDLRQPERGLGALRLHPHLAERGGEPGIPRQRQPADRHEVGRPEEDHPLDGRRRGGERVEGAARDRPRVDVARVRSDDRLGSGRPAAGGPARRNPSTIAVSSRGSSG